MSSRGGSTCQLTIKIQSIHIVNRLAKLFIETSSFRIRRLIATVICLEVAILTVFILISPSKQFCCDFNLSRTADLIRDKISKCPREMRKAMMNTSLPVSIYDNVYVKDELFSKCLFIDKSKTGLYRLMDERNFMNISCNTPQKRFLESGEKPGYTALASWPGSGNTWARHLLEELTGIHTGSLYMDRGLLKYFKAERHTERVIAIKSHEVFNFSKKLQFRRAILLIRDPYDAMLSHFNLALTFSHTDIPSEAKFRNNSFSIHVMSYLKRWTKFYVDWLQLFEGQVFLLRYERLKTDLLNSLTKMAAYFGTDVTLHHLWCIQKNKDGHFQRKSRPKWMQTNDSLNEDLRHNIERAREEVNRAIKKRRINLRNFVTND